MKHKALWLSSAFVAGLLLVGASAADPADKKAGSGTGAGCADSKVSFADGSKIAAGAVGERGGKPGAFQGGRGAFVQDGQGKGKGKGDGFQGGKGKGKGGKGAPNADVTVDRILSFDKNKDGKITKDELPERLQYLLELGDTNKDGALDKEEIEKLVANQQGFGGFGGFGGPKGAKGFPGGGKGGGFAGGPQAGGIQRALAALSISGATKDKADAIAKSHQENVNKLMDLARSDLLLKMKDVLNDQDYKTFKEAMDRPPGPQFGVVGGGGGGPNRLGELERRLDQLQKELDDVRRGIKR